MKGPTIRKVALALASVSLPALMAPSAAQAQTQNAARRDFNIPAQDMASALEAFGRQSGRDILFDRGQVAGRRSNAVRGSLEPGEALRRVVGGSGLSVTAPNAATFVVGRGSGEGQAGGTAADSESADQQEIVVTGTNIRGARVSSPIVTIHQDEMRLGGQNNLGEALRSLPQNFNGGQNVGIQVGLTAGDRSNRNTTGGSGFNLRGLGPDATLTLLNGTRLPYDGFVQATDVSAIPLAAISRVDVFLDGASAIYGSDAVAGVVNIVLRRDYRGVEFSARHGRATEGGFEQYQVNGTAGTTWRSGAFLVTADWSRNGNVLVGQRSYLGSYPSQNATIFPFAEQVSSLVTAHQRLSNSIEFAMDAFYTERDGRSRFRGSSTLSNDRSGSTIWGIVPSLRFELPAAWSIRVHGALGKNRAQNDSIINDVTTGAVVSDTLIGQYNDAMSVGAEAEGPLVRLPGGDMRLSVGGGYRESQFQQLDLDKGTGTSGTDEVYFAFGEIYAPVISDNLDVPFVRSLALNGAIRYESYNSFGGVATPKVGMTWEPVRDLLFRVSWGRSFKAPTLEQRLQLRRLNLLSGTSVGRPAGSPVMAILGGNPDLEPERAEVLTAGFTVQPRFLPGLSVEFGWFDIDYDNRVASPITPFSQALVNPAFQDFVILNPSVTQQNATFAALGLPVGSFNSNFSGAPYDPARVIAIVDASNVNSALQRAQGVDLMFRYASNLWGGSLNLTANASWLDSKRRLTSRAVELPTSGVIFFPARFRARAGGSWSRGGFTFTSYLNHIGGVRNTAIASAPMGESMTTFDLGLNFQVERGPFGNFEFNLTGTNLFNKEPPFAQPDIAARLPYDSTNYSALGRVISLTITKRF